MLVATLDKPLDSWNKNKGTCEQKETEEYTSDKEKIMNVAVKKYIKRSSMVATDQAETNFLTIPDKFLKFHDFSNSNT